ncbi:Hypothetical predicted protein [Octopus vulgaris]|uniref:Uncharacterized protein n=1 Tax=Octopus vulgaris TaxID=6645 RepID=A0AA36AG75_OCTVU|nr:Hypothetical predicted protein [Octopus vulgaris]
MAYYTQYKRNLWRSANNTQVLLASHCLRGGMIIFDALLKHLPKTVNGVKNDLAAISKSFGYILSRRNFRSKHRDVRYMNSIVIYRSERICSPAHRRNKCQMSSHDVLMPRCDCEEKACRARSVNKRSYEFMSASS